jgi:anti-anti-sigma regulatory factor
VPELPPPSPPPSPGPGVAPCVAGAVAVVLHEGMDAARLAALVAWVRGLLAGGGATCLRCDVAGLADVDLDAVDALARLALVARRAGVRACVWAPSPELSELIGLTGLTGVLPPCLSSQGGAEHGGLRPFA